MDTLSPQRRRFLKSLAGVSALAAVGPLRLGAEETTRLATVFDRLTTLPRAHALPLLTLTRTIFPHDFLDDLQYAEAVRRLDVLAAGDPAAAKLIQTGLDDLPGSFVDLDERSREAAVAAISDGRFFKLVRRTTAAAVYGNPGIWPRFGYPGPSLAFGGWVDRALVDIDWLPKDAS